MDKIRKGKRMMGNEENKTLYDIYRGILCNNQSFQLGKQAQVEYRFDCPEYAELKEKYHLNEIAGNGTELEHSVRLLKYLARNHHIVNVVRKCF
jgi:hypothetical protein